MSAYKVLIADDEPYVARVLRLVLQKEGYEVTCVSNGWEALESYEQIKHDLIVTDVKMPKMSGRELVESVRRIEVGNEVPVVVMTSTLESENRDWVHGVGNVSFLGKPVSPRDLVRIVNEQFAHRRAS